MQADVEQELQASANLLEQLGRDLPLHRVETLLQPALIPEPLAQLANRRRLRLDDGAAGDPHGARLRIQALAAAAWAADDAHVFLELHAPRARGGLLETR